jgi:hypothetical protein
MTNASRVCILTVYGQTDAVVMSQEPLIEDVWRARINTAALRRDAICDYGAEPENDNEAAAAGDGLSHLLCYRHPDLTVVDWVEIGPDVPGW